MHYITFSRKLGTGGTEIARQVAEQMKYALYDTEAIAGAARDMGLMQDIKEVDEKAPSVFRRFFSQKPAIVLDRLNAVVYELATRGDAVFVGRGSQVLLKSFSCALHVRVTASPERRVQNLLGRGFTKGAAQKAIEESDQERGGFIRYAFGVDWDEPELYDIVLNMDKVSLPLAVSTICGMARSSEIQACSVDALQSLEILALTKRAEAALLEAGLTYGPTTLVSVDVVQPGRVRLTGFVDEEASRTRAEGIVQALAGVRSVDNQIHLRRADRHA